MQYGSDGKPVEIGDKVDWDDCPGPDFPLYSQNNNKDKANNADSARRILY